VTRNIPNTAEPQKPRRSFAWSIGPEPGKTGMPAKRRRFQFGLRTLLLCIAIAGMLCACGKLAVRAWRNRPHNIYYPPYSDQ
jgi:hypothetical protein